MCGFEIIAKPDKNKRDHLLKQLISIVSCRFCRAEYDNEILLPYHTSAVDKRRFFAGGELGIRTLETFRSTAFRVCKVSPLFVLKSFLFVSDRSS